MGREQVFLTRILFLLLVAFETTGLRLKLIPWDSPDSPLYRENLALLQNYQTTNTSSHQLKTAGHPNSATKLDVIRFPLEDQQNYHYSVSVKIGYSGTEQKLLVDTGGSYMWGQCSWIFTPLSSKINTYKKLPCNHRLCDKQICKCIKKQCVCTIVYGTKGYKYRVEGFIGKIQIPGSDEISKNDIVFGCSTQQPLNLSGILGLDRSPVSLVSQLRKKNGGRFSYCLHSGDSYLTLGKDISDSGKKVKTTPFIYTDYSTYFLDLLDISVNGRKLGLSPTLFSLKNGGVYMGTGVRYTILPKQAYDKVNRAYQYYFKGKLKKIGGEYWDLKSCYTLKPGYDDFPTMTFHFEGADFEAEYTHVVDRNIGVACTAVVLGKTTVIGALQQWNTKFIFDINQNVLKFYKDNCAG
ncbi:hypothetical protein ABFS83_08G191400 [Erythranthe nasuta]